MQQHVVGGIIHSGHQTGFTTAQRDKERKREIEKQGGALGGTVTHLSCTLPLGSSCPSQVSARTCTVLTQTRAHTLTHPPTHTHTKTHRYVCTHTQMQARKHRNTSMHTKKTHACTHAHTQVAIPKQIRNSFTYHYTFTLTNLQHNE